MIVDQQTHTFDSLSTPMAYYDWAESVGWKETWPVRAGSGQVWLNGVVGKRAGGEGPSIFPSLKWNRRTIKKLARALTDR